MCKAKQTKNDEINNLVKTFEKIDHLRKMNNVIPIEMSDNVSDEGYNEIQLKQCRKKKKNLIRIFPYNGEMIGFN